MRFDSALPPDMVSITSPELSAHEILAPKWQELALLAATTMVAGGVLANIDSLGDLANFISPTLLAIALLMGCLQMVRRSVAAIWTPIFWVRVALLAYVGVGSIIPYFLNTETQNLMEAFYNYYPRDVAKYNLINGLFCFTLLLFFNGVSLYVFDRSKSSTGTSFEASRLGIGPFGALLLGVGLLVQLGLILPAQLGLVEANIPSILNEVAFAGQIGIFLLTYNALRNGSQSLWLVWGAALTFAFSGVLLFNKSVSLFPLVMVAMGYIYDRPSSRRIFASAAGVLLVYGLLAPLVSFGREAIAGSSSDDVQASLSERLDAVIRYAEGERAAGDSSQIQTGWARLSYVNVGTFAIDQYDQGQPGNSLRYLPIVWVPRALYRDKPTLTDIAKEFNYAATGSLESSSTPGLPTEGYWDYGWWGVPFFAAFVALIFAAWSHYTVAVVRSEAWHLFFIVLMGMRVGTRIDGLLVTDIVGPIGFAVLGHIALQFLNRLILRQRANRPLARIVR
jgi:hypothetical protein